MLQAQAPFVTLDGPADSASPNLEWMIDTDKPTDSTDADSPDKRVWRNAAGLVLGGGAADLLNVIVQAQIVIMLGPAGLGQLGQAQAVADVADGVGSMGMNAVGPVYGVRYEQRIGAFLGSMLALRSVASLLALVCVWAIAPLLESTGAWVVRLMALGLIAAPVATTTHVAFLLKQQNYLVAWVPGATALINIALLGLVIAFHPTLTAVVAVVVIIKYINAAWFFVLARRRYRFALRVDRGIMREMLLPGLKASWVEVVVISYMRASYFVLDGMGAAMLGFYSLADRITNPLLRIVGPLSGSALPVFAELAKAGSFAELASFYRRTLARLTILFAIMAGLVYGAAPWIIRRWLPDYEPAIDVMYVLMLGVGFMMFNQINVAGLNALGRFGTVAVVATVNLLVYALGAWLWIAPYKALGAAMATTVMEGCNMLMQLALLAYTFRQKTRGT